MRGSVWSPEAACSSTGPQAAVEARRGRQASRDRMNALIAFALKHRLLMLGLFVTVMVGGIIAFRQLNIEADRKSTRLNSSHQIISYAVFCLKKKKNNTLIPIHD